MCPFHCTRCMGARERAAQANRTTLGFHISRCAGISMGLLLFVGVHDCANEFMLESKSNAVSALSLVLFFGCLHECLCINV